MNMGSKTDGTYEVSAIDIDVYINVQRLRGKRNGRENECMVQSWL